MQAVSETYTRLLNTPGTIKQHKAVINGVEYGEEHIVGAPETSNSLFAQVNGPAIGQVNAGEIDISILPQGEIIPRRAEIRLFTRLAAVDYVAEVITECSEWLQKGVFFIDTRKPDDVTGVMTIHGYDAILLHGGEVYLAEGDVGTWPRAADVVVNDLAARFGLELDERTVIDPDILVSFPNDWTCRELLGYIGAAHGGNWTVTDAGKLRLVPLWSIPDETHFLIDELGNPLSFGGTRILVGSGGMDNPNTTGFDKTYLGRNMEKYGAPEAFDPFSRVTVQYDEENAFTAGDDTGRELSAYCPFATQDTVEKMLSALRGYQYQPFTAERAVLDPAAELGDGVTANGRYSVLAQCETTFNALMVSDVAAPADEEIDHELPYVDQTTRALQRKVTLGASYYGTSIGRKQGLHVAKTNADGTTASRATLNSDVVSFYNDDGTEALYFDINAGKFKFRGDVYVTGGSLNINDKFIVDEDGNAVLEGSTLLAADIIGSGFWSADENTKLDLLDADETEVGFGAGMILYRNGGGMPIFSVSSTVLTTEFRGFNNNEFLKVDSLRARPQGKWDFSGADVTGLIGGIIYEDDEGVVIDAGPVIMRLDNNQQRINFYFKYNADMDRVDKVWFLDSTGLHE